VVEFRSKEGRIRAVNRLSIRVYPREILGIVGESGCGKSVTAMAILSILASNGEFVAGSIRYRREDDTLVDITRLDPDGQEMRDLRGAEIAMIFQEPMTSLSPLHTIGDQISEAIALHGLKRGLSRRGRKRWLFDKTVEILRRVSLPNPEELFYAYPHNLSGGMRQRAMIAMGLACDPRILIADEPTTALDVTLQAQVLQLMREMQMQLRMSLIFITHDLGVIAEMADRVVVMYLGRAVEIAPVDQLFYQPLHPYTQGLINSIPKTSGQIEPLQPIEGTVPSALDLPTGCAFHTRCPHMMPGICNLREPPIREQAAGHQVACFLYEEDNVNAG
jgi:oligopeptide/dipeptide ABC transporter ATP-binding protein